MFLIDGRTAPVPATAARGRFVYSRNLLDDTAAEGFLTDNPAPEFWRPAVFMDPSRGGP